MAAPWLARRWNKLNQGPSSGGPPGSPPGGGGGRGRGGRGGGRGGGGGNGGGESALAIQSTRVFAPASTGNQDITIEGFGTPKAALFVCVGGVTDGTVRGVSYQGIGATDGTRQWVRAQTANNGISSNTTDSRGRRGTTDECIMFVGGDGSVVGEANFVEWITDGVRVNWGAAPSNAFAVHVVLFGGTDLSAYATKFDLAAQNNVVTVTPGFETHAAFFASNFNPANDNWDDGPDGGSGSIRPSFGFAGWDGSTLEQAAHGFLDFFGATTTMRGYVSDSAVIQIANQTWNCAVENISSTAFDVRSNGTDWSPTDAGVLALNLPGHSVHVGIEDSPTATGDHDFTSPDFEPVFSMLLPTMITTVDDIQVDAPAGGYGISVIDGAAQYSGSWAHRAGVTTMDTQSLTDDQAVNLDDHTGAAAFDATFDQFLATGLRLNFSVVPGTARKWPAIYIA